jgi:tripartite-type tricarboxylate transporter receptor subunit TctC
MTGMLFRRPFDAPATRFWRPSKKVTLPPYPRRCETDPKGFSMNAAHRLNRSLATLALGAAICTGAPARADYPEKTIRIVTINAPGGPADIVARLIADKLSAAFGKPVVVESMVGAGGSLAAGHVAKAAPDGHTLLMSGDAALVTNLSLYEKLSYDPVKDLAPISQIVTTPNILAVPMDLPVKDVADLVALGRTKPGTLTFAHGGLGFSTHLSGETFKAMAQIDIQHVAFRASVLPDLLAGRVSMCFCNVSLVMPQVRENKLRALAVTSPQRSPAAPDLPTMNELGFTGFDVTSWFALMAPSGTAKPIIARLHQEVIRILALPDIRAKFADLGMDVVGNSPAELANIIATQMPQREKLIKAIGIKLQ